MYDNREDHGKQDFPAVRCQNVLKPEKKTGVIQETYLQYNILRIKLTKL